MLRTVNQLFISRINLVNIFNLGPDVRLRLTALFIKGGNRFQVHAATGEIKIHAKNIRIDYIDNILCQQNLSKSRVV